MSDARLQKIGTLRRLRARDIDRRAREVAEAAAASERADAVQVSAERAREAATGRLDAALVDRVRSPGDECVTVYCRACEDRLGEARAAVDEALVAAEQARDAVAAARRQWLRAQVRHEALDQLYRKTQAGLRRAADRRLADETNEQAATANRMMMA